MDGFPGSTTYQGFFLTPNQLWDGQAPERVELDRDDIRGTSASRYLLWLGGQAPAGAGEVWVSPAADRVGARDQFLWPEGASVWDPVRVGRPPAGSFVAPGAVGIGDVSPGYR